MKTKIKTAGETAEKFYRVGFVDGTLNAVFFMFAELSDRGETDFSESNLRSLLNCAVGILTEDGEEANSYVDYQLKEFEKTQQIKIRKKFLTHLKFNLNDN